MTPRILDRLLSFTGVPILATILTLAWATHDGYQAPPLATVFTPYLPFNMIAAHSPQKVFAHYMPGLPISIDNEDADRDYYAREYLSVDGENGKHAAYGGYLRDRPIPRPPSTIPDWKLADLRTEIAQAKSVGIDGFAVDVIDLRVTSTVVEQILQAAATADDFTIVLTTDLTGPFGKLTAADFAAEIAPYLSSPGAYRLSDGRRVLGAFAAELQTPTWWASALDVLRRTYKLDVAFVPTFVRVGDNLEKFAPFSYGFAMWGGRSPKAMSTDDTGRGSPVDVITRTRKLGKIWMQPVAFQDSRPGSGIFEESENGLTNRMAWQLADQQHAEWVQLITWNDYTESTAMAPSVAHGWRILDMNAYDILRFKFGRTPRVLRDAVYLSYRDQPVGALPAYHETTLMHVVPSSVAPRNTIEVVSFATAPSNVSVTAGVEHYSCRVPVGRGVCTFPLSIGSISVTMQRDGEVVAEAQSNADVTAAPYVQDLQYRVVGGLR